MTCRDFCRRRTRKHLAPQPILQTFCIRLSGRYARGKRPRESEEDVENQRRGSRFLPHDQPLGAHDQRSLLKVPQEWRLPSL